MKVAAVKNYSEIKPSLGELMMTMRKRLHEKAKQELPRELTFEQADILVYISHRNKVTMDQIAKYLNVKPPTATSLIEKLEKKGFVRRKKNSADKRVVEIELTQKVKDRMERLWELRNRILDSILAKLSSRDKNHLERIIGILIQE